MESYICTVKDKMKNIEESVLAILFISALCFAGTDSVNYSFFVHTKLVSLILFLIVYAVWSKRSLVPWRQFEKVLALWNVSSSSRNREAPTVAFTREGLEKIFKPSDTNLRRGSSSRRRRRSYGHVRRNAALEQLSLW